MAEILEISGPIEAAIRRELKLNRNEAIHVERLKEIEKLYIWGNNYIRLANDHEQMVEAGPANSAYAANEHAKRELIEELAIQIQDMDFQAALRFIGKSFRRRDKPKWLRRIIERFDQHQVVADLFGRPVKYIRREFDRPRYGKLEMLGVIAIGVSIVSAFWLGLAWMICR